MKTIGLRSSILSALMLALVTVVPVARADVTFHLDTLINGTAPADPTPWMTATFHDNAPGDVLLTMTNNMPAGEFIDQLVFNSIVNPTSLSFLNLTIPPPAATTFHAAQDLTGGANMKAGLFNIFFDYPTAAADRWDGGMVSQWHITGGTVTSSNFLLTSIDDGHMVGGPYYMAAHVQGIPSAAGTTSGSVGSTTVVPEPDTYAMMLVGLGLLGFIARRRNRNTAA